MDNRGSLVFFLIAIYLLLNTQTRPPLIDQDREHQLEVSRERQALSLLNESSYGDFQPWSEKWLPFTGLRSNDSFAWDALPEVQNRARHQLQSALLNAGLEPPAALEGSNTSEPLNITQYPLPVYRNVTGRLRGDWIRQEDVSIRPRLNMTALALENDYITHDFSLNITGDSGTFYLDMFEGCDEEVWIGDGHIREIKGSLAVESNNVLGSTWYLSLYGVHFPETGGIILTTSSEKFDGLFSLPHLALSQDSFDLSRQLLLKSLSDAISEEENTPEPLFPWSSITGSEMAEFPAPKCEHIVYLQQHPVMIENHLTDKIVLEQIEQEIRYPTGAPIPSPPNMVMSAIMFSPDCGYILKTKGAPDYPPSEELYLSGMKKEQFIKYAVRLIFLICAVFSAQISLLFRQMKEASTPSTKSRISFYTLAMMAFGDAFVLIFILLELYSEASFLILAATSLLAFLSVSYLGMKFMMEIWAVQAPERREQDRQTSSQTSAARQRALPLPATAGRDTGATPIIISPDQDTPAGEDTPANRDSAQRDPRSDVGAMYARFYFILLVSIFVSLWAFLWPNRLGALYARTLGFIYLSFWIPQIYRNVMRNCRKALRWDFVVGQSILRLFPFVYFFTIQDNVLFIRSDSTTAYTMLGWVWIQVWVLVSQDILGPRFFVPRGWAPPAYDYHPVLRDTAESDRDLESGVLSIGALRADERDPSEIKDQDKQRSKDRKRKIFDCAICMQEIEVPVLAAPGTAGGSSMADGATSILSRRAYMVTPCRHIFHSTCLESWMRLRLQCPICRESIPPV